MTKRATSAQEQWRGQWNRTGNGTGSTEHWQAVLGIQWRTAGAAGSCSRMEHQEGRMCRGGSFLFIKAQPAGRLSLPGPSAVLVKQLKTGSCHAEWVELPAPGEPELAFVKLSCIPTPAHPRRGLTMHSLLITYQGFATNTAFHTDSQPGRGWKPPRTARGWRSVWH